jgi:BMFP domain-containing protein YqiC
MPGLIGQGSIPIVVQQRGQTPVTKYTPVTQTTNRFFDELSKLLTDAAGAAQGMRREVETLMKAQGERILRDMDVVQREEFEAVKEMAAKARDENERLSARVSELESELARLRQ